MEMMMRILGMLALGLMVLSSGLLFADDGPSSSGIYRSVDANGNVVFTDQPPENGEAEEVELRELNTVPGEKMRTVLDSAEDDLEGADDEGYTRLVIISPGHEATVRNPQSAVQVAVEIEPALKAGDTMVLYDNGVEQPGMELEWPDRGVHTLIVKVLDEDGEVKISSPAIEFYIHRSSVGDFRDRSGGYPTNAGSAASPGGAASQGAGASTNGGVSVGGAAKPARPIRPAQPRPTPRN